MADPKKRAKARTLSPRGIAKFPYIVTPDTKFKAEGEYVTKLVLDGRDAAVAKFLEKVEAMRDAAVEQIKAELTEAKKLSAIKTLKVADVPFRAVLNDQGEETGQVEITFKLPATFKDRKTGELKRRTLPLFDAAGFEVKNRKGLEVWSGSELIVSFYPLPYYNAATKSAGVTLRMAGVQLCKVVSGGPRDAASFGFGKTDGDFSADTVKDDSPFAEQPTSDASGGDDEEDF